MKLALLAVLVAPLDAARGKQEAAPVFTRFDFSRERILNRVIAEAVLQNPLSGDMENVEVVAIYYDGERELQRSKPATIARLAHGQSAKLVITTDRVEKFDRYEVSVVYGDWQYNYAGEDILKPPILKRTPPPKLELSSQRDARPAAFPGDSVVTLSVKNTGGGKGREPTAALTFHNGFGKPVHLAYVRLGAPLEPGTEDTFEVVVPRCPDYVSIKAVATCLLFEIPLPQEPFTGAAEIQVGKCRLVRLRDGSARMNGMVRNGLATAIKQLVVAFDIGGVKHALQIAGPVRAGALENFEFYVPDCPPLKGNTYEFTLDFEEAVEPKTLPPDLSPRARRTSSRRIGN